MPNAFTYLHQTPIFGWYVVWCNSKNGYQKHMCKRDWNAPNMTTILSSIVDIFGGPVYSFIEHKNLHFDIVEDICDIHMSSKKYEDCGYGVVQCMFHVLGETGSLENETIQDPSTLTLRLLLTSCDIRIDWSTSRFIHGPV